MKARRALRKRGTPLAMLAILLGGWVLLRIATWDSPIVFPAMAMAPAGQTQSGQIAGSNAAGTISAAMAPSAAPAPHSIAYPHLPTPAQFVPGYGYVAYAFPPQYAPGGALPHVVYVYPSAYPIQSHPMPSAAYRNRPNRGEAAFNPRPLQGGSPGSPYPLAPTLGATDPRVTGGAFAGEWSLQTGRGDGPVSRKREGKRYSPLQQTQPPFAAQPTPAQQSSKNRWLLDAYGFYRQGSSALSVSQGRQPIYGASQLAANLQWRARPSSTHDPRVYARAYHALVTGGESELAGGVSARPLGKVPVRLYGELRVVRNPAISQEGISSSTDLRPAGYAVTEFSPQKLPLGFSLEAYGAGGYVGGEASTYFLDGQAAVTRPIARIGKPGIGSAAVSVGAGVWGGAQEGVSRVDIGPTLRFDVDIGKIPARVSVDYREQVAGDAEPDSGVAATVSTRF